MVRPFAFVQPSDALKQSRQLPTLAIAACLSCAAPVSSVPHRDRPASEAQAPATPLDSQLRGAVRRDVLRDVSVPGFTNALLFSPAGNEKRPLLVAAHGAGGSPEWDCEYWRRLTNDRAFILCIRGTPLGRYPGYFYRDHHALERELVAAEAAARALEPRISEDSGLYAGFSQGSTMGTAMISAHAQELPYLVLIESFELWSVPRARAFLHNGGKRVLLACGSKECAKVGQASLRWLQRAGVESRLEFRRGEGHTPMGEVQSAVATSLPWLLGNDPLWQ